MFVNESIDFSKVLWPIIYKAKTTITMWAKLGQLYWCKRAKIQKKKQQQQQNKSSKITRRKRLEGQKVELKGTAGWLAGRQAGRQQLNEIKQQYGEVCEHFIFVVFIYSLLLFGVEQKQNKTKAKKKNCLKRHCSGTLWLMFVCSFVA